MKKIYETPSLTIEKFDLHDPDILTDVMSGGWGEGEAPLPDGFPF